MLTTNDCILIISQRMISKLVVQEVNLERPILSMMQYWMSESRSTSCGSASPPNNAVQRRFRLATMTIFSKPANSRATSSKDIPDRTRSVTSIRCKWWKSESWKRLRIATLLEEEGGVLPWTTHCITTSVVTPFPVFSMAM